MHQQGILKTDDLITRFFRLCTEMCVEISYRAQAEQQHNPAASAAIIRAKCYHNLDAFVRLIALLVKHSGEATNTVTKINLLNKVNIRRILTMDSVESALLCKDISERQPYISNQQTDNAIHSSELFLSFKTRHRFPIKALGK